MKRLSVSDEGVLESINSTPSDQRLEVQLAPSDPVQNILPNDENNDVAMGLERSAACMEKDDDLTVPLLPSYKQPTTCSLWSNITIEPMLFLFMIASNLQSTVTKSLVVEKVCFSLTDTNSSDFCQFVNDNDTMEATIQSRAASIEMYNTIVETVPAIFISIFMGAFSDKHGRKLPMILPIVGFILTVSILGVFSYFMTEIPAELVPLAALPKAFGGGVIALIVMGLSFVSDLTTSETRTARVAAVEAVMLLSQPLGALLGGWLYKFSYLLVYLVSFFLSLLSLLYLVFFISDVRITSNENERSSSLFRDFFNISHLKETVFTVLKQRPMHDRRHILLLMLVSVIGLLPFFGNTAILFLYTRLRFNWDLATYSYFGAIISISITIGLVFIAVVLVRWLKMPDPGLAVVGLLASMTSSVLLGFMTSPLMIYLICIPIAFCGGTSLAVRSQVSKLVPREEQGKVFSILGTVEIIVPLVASVMYTEIYSATVNTFPGLVFLISASVLVFPLAIIIYVFADMHMIAQNRL
ncbi:hypothetical protein CHUAL_007108 [Chamberlinius hualienensis]